MEKENLVNHPSHYTHYPMEVIDMMVAIWGKEKVAEYCTLNAFKYRMRAGHKDNIEQDLAKEAWYLNKAKELMSNFQIGSTRDRIADTLINNPLETYWRHMGYI